MAFSQLVEAGDEFPAPRPEALLEGFMAIQRKIEHSKGFSALKSPHPAPVEAEALAGPIIIRGE